MIASFDVKELEEEPCFQATHQLAMWKDLVSELQKSQRSFVHQLVFLKFLTWLLKLRQMAFAILKMMMMMMTDDLAHAYIQKLFETRLMFCIEMHRSKTFCSTKSTL